MPSALGVGYAFFAVFLAAAFFAVAFLAAPFFTVRLVVRGAALLVVFFFVVVAHDKIMIVVELIAEI